MKRKLYFVGFGLSCFTIIPAVYFLENKKDSVYIPGGLIRGLRCGINASLIGYNYLTVLKYLI